MGTDTVKQSLPDYTRDLKLNLGALATIASLSDQQRWGAVVAAVFTSPRSGASADLVAEARDHLLEQALEAAKAAAAIMAMNNVYYQSKHLLAEGGATDYEHLPARLRMQVIAERAGIEKVDFELWCLVASAINGCGACLVAHERSLRAGGFTADQVHEGLRIASVVHAVCASLAAEESLRVQV